MDIQQLKEERIALEENIREQVSDLLEEFLQKTKVPVMSISLSLRHDIGDGEVRLVAVNEVTVRLHI